MKFSRAQFPPDPARLSTDCPLCNSASSWTRPTEWLTLSALAPTDEKFVGLLAVYDNNSQYIAFSAAGNYTVDWGDGSAAENVESGVAAQHQYIFSSISNTTDVYEVDGLIAKYRQVIVTVTMQSEQSFTGINLQKRHSAQSASYSAPWLDIKLNGPLLDTIVISNTGQTVALKHLEKIEIGVIKNNIANFVYMFHNCHALASVSLFDTSASTNFTGMFQNCHSLLSVPIFNTALGQTFSAMFYGCYSLLSVPLLNTSSGTNFQNMFGYCSSLKTIPAINTSQGTNFSSMFSYCYAITTIPLLDTSQGTNFNYMIMFCVSLSDMPLLDTSKATTVTNMFQGCAALPHIPKLNTVLCTVFSGMFNGCSSLVYVPQLNTSTGANFGYMFMNCSALNEMPALDMSAATTLTSMFEGCKSLTRSRITGATKAISYIYCRLSRTEILEVFNNLGTAVAGTVITLTGNPDAAALTADDRLIATNKGWTITI